MPQKLSLSAERIRLWSDGKLYPAAVNFAGCYDPSVISRHQLNGLWSAVGSGELREVFLYIDNRLKRKTISEELRDFYKELKQELKALDTGTTEQCAYLLAKEFIQHLIAECNYQRSLSDA